MVDHSVAKRHGLGGKRVTRPEEDNDLTRYFEKHPFESCRRAMQATGFSGCVSTARNRLVEVNIGNYIAAIKPKLNDRQRKERLRFAETCLDKNLDFWNKVFFLTNQLSSYIRMQNGKGVDNKTFVQYI